MANSFSMTGLLISLSLAGESVFSADIGIVQAATLALFYAFSGNTRNLILNQQSGVTAKSVLNNRLVLIIPLAIMAYWLSVPMAGVPSFLAIVLILRRGVEWLDEIYLSEVERLDLKSEALSYTFIQAVLLLIGFIWQVTKMPYPLLGLMLWALLPLVLSWKFYRDNFPDSTQIFRQSAFRKLLPHIGSTMIIGITVYIFRLLVIMMTGKSTAGDLFTAFAIGGLLGSVFANAVGPSLALHQKRSLDHSVPKIINLLLIGFLITGLALTYLALIKFNLLSLFGKSYLFWLATGLSMIAGTIMVFAQMIRHRLLQHHQEQDLFGPDVMMNILIIAAVPFGYYMFGINMMAALYLLSATFAFLFYASYEFGIGLKSGLSDSSMKKLKIIILVLLFVPIFFQINGGIFNDRTMIFDSKGVLSLLPIPVSVLGCFIGILSLGNYQQARLSFAFIFMTFVLMTFATIITTGKNMELEQSKFIFLLQFIMPMFGLVLGQFFYHRYRANDDLNIEKTLFFVLFVFVPLQLFCTWMQGFFYLHSYMYIISVYQHLQYVPVIFVCAFLLAFVRLWSLDKYKIYLLVLMILMGIYVAASLSTLAILTFYFGLILVAIYFFKFRGGVSLAVLLLVNFFITAAYVKNMVEPQMSEKIWASSQSNKSVKLIDPSDEPAAIEIKKDIIDSSKSSRGNDVEVDYKKPVLSLENLIPENLKQRLMFWNSYFIKITKSPQAMLFGHPERPDRILSPSAHNYYLDFIFNFGVLALLPFLILAFYTVKLVLMVLSNKKTLDNNVLTSIIVLSSIVFFLLFVDSLFKVSLRQPYSGMFAFFLWGLLLSKLLSINSKAKNVVKA